MHAVCAHDATPAYPRSGVFSSFPQENLASTAASAARVRDFSPWQTSKWSYRTARWSRSVSNAMTSSSAIWWFVSLPTTSGAISYSVSPSARP